jgi:hypothetical protein
MFLKKNNSQTKLLFSFIIACFLKSTNMIQSFREVRRLKRFTLRDFHYTHQDFIVARQKYFEFDFNYNSSFSFFKLFSSVISNLFSWDLIFDFSSDTNLFDLNARELSLISLEQSFQFSSVSLFLSLSLHNVRRRHQNDFSIRNNAIERFFRVSNMTKKMRNQLIFMNFWHYVEIENVESTLQNGADWSGFYPLGTRPKPVWFRSGFFRFRFGLVWIFSVRTQFISKSKKWLFISQLISIHVINNHVIDY